MELKSYQNLAPKFSLGRILALSLIVQAAGTDSGGFCHWVSTISVSSLQQGVIPSSMFSEHRALLNLFTVVWSSTLMEIFNVNICDGSENQDENLTWL